MSIANPAKLKEVHNLKQDFIVFCAARVPQTQRLYIGSSDFKVYEIDFAAEKPEPVPFSGVGHESYVTGVAMSGSHLVSGGYDGRLVWWDTETRKPVRVAYAHEKWIRRVVASPDGSLVASVGDDMVCKVWNAETGELVREITDHKASTPNHYPSMLYALTFSSDGNLMATGDKVGHVAVWDMALVERKLPSRAARTKQPRGTGGHVAGISLRRCGDRELHAGSRPFLR